MAEDVNIRINVDAQNGVKQTESLKSQMRQLKEEGANLQMQTDGLSEASIKYAQQLGELQDAMGDAQAMAKYFADDFKGVNTALQGLQGGIGVVSTLSAGISLFGGEGEVATEVIKKMQIAQTALNGVMAVQKVLNKDSYVMIALRVAAMKQLEKQNKKTAASEVEGTAATAALAAGEGVATLGAIGLKDACKAVGVAIKNIPVIGWILAAIAALTALITWISSANDESEEGIALQEAASENLERQKAKYEAVDAKIIEIKDDLNTWNDILLTADKNSTIYKETLKKLGDELGVDLENQQIDTSTLNKLENIHLEIKKKQLEAEFNQNQYLADRNKLQQINNVLNAASALDHKERAQFIQDELGISEKAAADYAAAIHNAMENHTTWMDAIADSNTSTGASYKRLGDEVDSYAGKQKKTTDEIKDLMAEEDKIIEDAGLKRKGAAESTGKSVAKTAKNTTNEVDKAAEEEAKKIKQRADEVANGIADASKKIADYNKESDKAIREENEKTHSGRLFNIQAEYGETIATLDKELEDYKTFYNQLSDEEKQNALTVEQFANEQTNLRQQALDRFLKAQQDELTAEERLRIDEQNRIDDAVLQTRLANVVEGSAEYYELQQEILDEQREQELESLQRQYDDELISKEEFEAQKAQIEADYNQKSVANAQAAEQSKMQATTDRIQQVGQMLQMASDFTTALMDAELAAAGDDEKKQKEIKKKYAVANAMMQIGQIGVQTALGAISAFQAMAGIPVVGPALGAVAAALVTATGVAQMVKAGQEANKIKQAKRGAFVVGPSHSEGGVQMELEGGEVVLNKRAMAIPQYRAIASAMNSSTGGVAFPGAASATAQPMMTSQVDTASVKAIVSETVAAVTAIPVVVSEGTITKTQRKVSTIEGRSRI